jgi:hypothetical protein
MRMVWAGMGVEEVLVRRTADGVEDLGGVGGGETGDGDLELGTTGLGVRDVSCIIDAWEDFAREGGTFISLKDLVESRENGHTGGVSRSCGLRTGAG